jgi:hypothetical protein
LLAVLCVVVDVVADVVVVVFIKPNEIASFICRCWCCQARCVACAMSGFRMTRICFFHLSLLVLPGTVCCTCYVRIQPNRHCHLHTLPHEKMTRRRTWDATIKFPSERETGWKSTCKSSLLCGGGGEGNCGRQVLVRNTGQGGRGSEERGGEEIEGRGGGQGWGEGRGEEERGGGGGIHLHR